MKSALSLTIGSVALAALTLPVLAADLDHPYPPPPFTPTPALNWSGFYLGVGVGGRWIHSDWTTTCLEPAAVGCPNNVFRDRFTLDNPSAFNVFGARGSVYGGYNWQFANWVVGVEGDWGFADDRVVHAGFPGTHLPVPGLADTATVRNLWDGSVRARLGYLATPSALVYATGGVSFIDQEVSAACVAGSFFVGGWCSFTNASTFSKTLVGWTVGGGIEWMFLPAWVARAEYRFTDYTNDSPSARFFTANPVDSFDATIDQRTHTFYVGLSYLFNSSTPYY